jgi:hypothetical protein
MRYIVTQTEVPWHEKDVQRDIERSGYTLVAVSSVIVSSQVEHFCFWRKQGYLARLLSWLF